MAFVSRAYLDGEKVGIGDRMETMSGVYLDCILNRRHNDFRVCSVSDLGKHLNELQNGNRVWSVFRLYLKLRSV